MTARCAPEIKQTVIHLVLADFDRLGLAWLERPVERTNRADTLHDIRTGEIKNVVQIIEIEFTPAGISSRDVTQDFLAEVEPQPTHRELYARSLWPPRQIAALDPAHDLRKHGAV